MMTDLRGRTFISYRRSPARPTGTQEAALVRDALRNLGLPTWRDLDDLSFEPTESEIVTTITDPGLAGAILLISPEVADSPIIQNVEAFRIFRRYKAHDGFYVLPVLIGLDYGEANTTLGAPAGFQDIGDWNIHKVEGDTITPSDARNIANRVLRERLHRLRDAEPDASVCLGLFSRRMPARGSFSLRHDFSPYFDGRTATQGAYSKMEDALIDGASAILEAHPSPEVVGEGMAALPLGALFGAVYSPRAGINLAWRQFVEGRDHQRWAFDLPIVDFETSIRVTPADTSSEDLVLAIGLSADIEQAVTESLDAHGVKHRASIYCEPKLGTYKPGQVLAPEEGIAFALAAVRVARAAKDDLGLKRANLHLFLACPLAMAVMIGQKLNTFSECYLYEHNPNNVPSYTIVHRFHPSGYTYR